MNILQAKGIRVAYHGKSPVVNGIDFAIPQGEKVALIGESGCGKTTLARAVMGLVPLESGEMIFRDRNGTNVNNPIRTQRAKLVQMIFQDPYQSLNPRHTIQRTLREAILAGGGQEDTCDDAACEKLLVSVGLDKHALPKYPHEFSGGQRQRISIARALAPEPSLLICDEAVSALDVTTQKKVIELLVDLCAKRNLTLFFISHDLPLVQDFCDQILVMEGGLIVESGSTSEVLSDPQSQKTKDLINSVIAL